jgi:transposase
MRTRKRVAEDIEEIKQAMRNTTSKAEFQRLQCIYLADTQQDMAAERIGEIVMLSSHRVKMIHSNFRKNGMDAIKEKRGGRYRENMTFEEEIALLHGFEEESMTGKLVLTDRIKAAYEAKVGREVVESTIYRMLARHGFRKIVPYQRHPKASKETQETFKKTFRK